MTSLAALSASWCRRALARARKEELSVLAIIGARVVGGELWRFCGLSGGQRERAARMLAFLREQGDEPDWWETGARRARQQIRGRPVRGVVPRPVDSRQ
jgi:hypothetical protein